MKPAKVTAPEADEPITSIAEYSPTAAALADLARRMSKVVYDVSTPKGMAAAKADRAEVRDLRVALEKKRVEIKAPALKRCNEIDTEAKRITALLLPYEEAPDKVIKAHEAAIEAERQRVIKAEQDRMADLQQRVAELRGAIEVVRKYNLTAAQIAEHIEDLEAIAVDASFQELQESAAKAKAETLAQLAQFRDAAAAREAEDARLKQEREELARQRAQQEARDKAAREAFEEDQRKVREAQRIENERIAAEQAAAQKKIDDARRELEDRQEADRQATEAREREVQVLREKVEREAEEQRRLAFKPTFDEIVQVVADHWGRDLVTASGWVETAVLAR
jgi:hypothetical protein